MAAEIPKLIMHPDHPQFEETTDEFNELLATKSNLFKTYTGDFLNLCLQLQANKVIGGEEYDRIYAGETHAEKVMRMVACFKSKGFNAIPEIRKSYLKTTNATVVPDLLEKFWNSNVLPKISPPEGCSKPMIREDNLQKPAKDNGGLDFVVTEAHRKGIADILCSKLSQKHWDEIKQCWLPLEILNGIDQHLPMKLDVLACLQEWIIKSETKEKLFSKFIQVFNDYAGVKEVLEENRALLMKA